MKIYQNIFGTIFTLSLSAIFAKKNCISFLYAQHQVITKMLFYSIYGTSPALYKYYLIRYTQIK